MFATTLGFVCVFQGFQLRSSGLQSKGSHPLSPVPHLHPHAHTRQCHFTKKAVEATQTDQVSGLRAQSQKPRREAAAKSSGDTGTWAQGYVRSSGPVGLSGGCRGTSSAGREGGDPVASRKAANILATDTWLSFWVPLRPLLPELQQKSHLLSHPIAGMVSSDSLKPHLSRTSMPSSATWLPPHCVSLADCSMALG